MSPASTEIEEVEMSPGCPATSTEIEEVEMSPGYPAASKEIEEVEMSPAASTEIEEVEMSSASTEIAEEMNSWTTTDRETNPSTSTSTYMDSINIPVPPPPPPMPNQRRSRTPKSRPCTDLLGSSSRDRYFEFCVPLYEASVTGNCAAAEVILRNHPEFVRFAITEGYDTALHVATSAEETKQTIDFVKKLLGLMTNDDDLELLNRSDNTAFCLAAAAGNIEMVKIMMNRHPSLHDIAGADGMMPLYVSVVHQRHDTAKHLYDASRRLTGYFWTPHNRGSLLLKCVEGDLFDIALDIAKERPTLTMNGSVLRALARKPDAFGLQQNLVTRVINSIRRITEKDSDALQLLRIIWRNTIKKMSKSEVEDMLRGPRDEAGKYSSRMLFVAAEMGNAKFVIELLRAYPDLIWKTNDDTHSIFHVAVMNRCQDIHNLLYEIGTVKDLITPRHDKDGNNMFHLVGKTSVKMRPQTYGASLLMQRELLWFKEIEKMVPPSLRERKNNDGKTPYELFSEENEDLVFQGLKWMKYCMLVVTLIVTVAFAVAFTVPGGYKQEIGTPIFIHGQSFLVFVVADAIALFSSSTSLLVFLSILTSRHGQRDFMYALPRKLMIGLITLFISVAALMITFSASFVVLYRNKLKWVPILIGAFAVMPVIVFVVLEFPHLVDIFLSMYDSRYLFKPRKRMLYNTHPRL